MSDLRDLWRDAEGPYDRPNLSWHCGAEVPCAGGPLNGHCPGRFACEPERTPDGWHCTRAEEAGGACAAGPRADGCCCTPLPSCVPRRSLAARRRLVTLATAGVALSILVMAGFATLAQPGVPWLFSPGELSQAHAEFTADCMSCHLGVADSVHLAAMLQSRLGQPREGAPGTHCLACHSLPDTLAHNPHGLALAYLHDRGTTDRFDPHLMPDAREPRACVACHVEHRGQMAQLNPEPGAVCSTCHQIDASSYEAAHPTFAAFRFEGYTRWNFDHAAHELEHFGRFSGPFTCIQCHNAGDARVPMATNPFEASCAGCHHHLEQIAAVRLPLFQLPGIDLEPLEDEEIGIGSWPADAGLDLESGISPFLRLLLDDNGNLAADRLTAADVRLWDLMGEEAYLDDVAAVAWSIKLALADVQSRGADALRQRLSSRLGRRLPGDTDLLLGQWAEVLNRASTQWFPSLQADIEALQEGTGAPTVESRGYQLRAETRGDWTTDTREFLITYNPRTHADAVTRLFYEVGVRGGRNRPLLELLLEERMAGTCMKCHETGRRAGAIDWAEESSAEPRGSRPSSTVAGWFDHGPHLSVESCVGCHVATGQGAPPFEDVPVASCSTCHTAAGTASMQCAACHRYHSEMPEASVPGRTSERIEARTDRRQLRLGRE